MRRLSVLLASAVMALSLIAFAVVSGASAAPNQQPPQPTNQFYGALDYSKAKGALYWGLGTSKDAANQAAYDVCTKSGATDCLTIVWVYNGWVAVAESSKFFDVGWGATKQAASKAAVKRCGAGCKATTWGHTDIDPNKRATGGYTLPGP
jgi:hypothetical protein